jgi:cation/acetate symporter
MVDLPGVELESLGRRLLQMFGSVGASAYSLVILAVMGGVASNATALMRTTTTASVLASRTSMAWAVLITAFLILTMTAIAVYLRGYVTEQVLARPADRLPGWFQSLMQDGIATIDARGSAPVSLAGIAFARDSVLSALPVAVGLPNGFVAIALIGALAACLAAAAAHVVTLGFSIGEDIIFGGTVAPADSGSRLLASRLAMVVVMVACVMLTFIATDPLLLLVWAWTISASAIFPLLVLAVLWKRLSALGAMAGLASGFALSILLLLLDQQQMLAPAAPLSAVIAGPIAFFAAIGVSLVTRPPDRATLELLRDMRVPGGETIMDRQRRLLRLKHGD